MLPPSQPDNTFHFAKTCTPVRMAPQNQPARPVKVLQSATVPHSKVLSSYTTLNATQLSQEHLTPNKIHSVCHMLGYSTAQNHFLSTTVFLLKCFKFPSSPENICISLHLPNPSDMNFKNMFCKFKTIIFFFQG